jgi:Holliday junction resolvase
MGLFSRNKGARGERELSMFCREQGYANVHRTAQYRGNTGDAGDLEGLPGIHIECKRVEKFHIREALAQAAHDAKAKGNIPVVFQRGSNQKWIAVMDAEDWFKLYREYEAGRNDGN